jgi:tRNA(Met) cytidine acetyltransferase
VDWLGVGYGATPELVSFWHDNGFSTVHLSTTRNDRSGEHSAVMLDPLTPAGQRLHDRHSRWLCQRLPGVLGDALADVDPDVVRATLRSVDATPPLSLSDWEWRVAAGITAGTAILDTAPRPVARLALHYFGTDGQTPTLGTRQERLLVTRALQRRSWDAVATALDFETATACKRTLSDAVRPLVDAYGGETARAELERLE